MNVAMPFLSESFSDRALPSLPPIVFGVDEILPASWVATAVGEISLQLYRRQRIRRALGDLPAGTRLLPGRQPQQQPSAAHGGGRDGGENGPGGANSGQFRDDFAAATWNADAFFCVDDGKYQAKIRHLASLLSNHDAVAVQETHGTAGLYLSWRPPRGSRGCFPLVWMQIQLELAWWLMNRSLRNLMQFRTVTSKRSGQVELAA